MQSISTPPKVWQIGSLLSWAAAHLAERGVEDARLNVDLLLAHVLSLDRLGLYLQFDRPLSPAELEQFRTLFKRRREREPLQYILGETDFMGLRLWVDPTVLIPRPETEQVVEQALEILSRAGLEHPRVLDIGTGSGNIAIAIAHRLPASAVTAVDKSTAALRVAERNVRRHGLENVRLLELDILSDLALEETFDLVISNPPYVPASEFETLEPEIRQFEPRDAVTDSGDGSAFLRRILNLAPRLTTPGGAVVVEIAWNQAEVARRVALEEGLEEVRVAEDYAGNPRILVCRSGARKKGSHRL